MTGAEARALRIARRWRVADVAARWGVVASTISTLERKPEVPADYAARYAALELNESKSTGRGPYGLAAVATLSAAAKHSGHFDDLTRMPSRGAPPPTAELPPPLLDERGIRLYVGDCRSLLPALRVQPSRGVVVTDPIWPDAPPEMFGLSGLTATRQLLGESARWWPALAERAVVVLGCGSDPRVLSVLPDELVFQRVSWCRYARPIPRGDKLLTSDVVYVYGRRDASRPYPPGEVTSTGRRERARGPHPCPRDSVFCDWLIHHYTAPGDVVIDPFAGSGRLLVAAARAGREAIGIEVIPEYARQAADELRARWAQAVLPLEMTR
jgi:hypothetical protein